jgi:hypothetical protein
VRQLAGPVYDLRESANLEPDVWIPRIEARGQKVNGIVLWHALSHVIEHGRGQLLGQWYWDSPIVFLGQEP